MKIFENVIQLLFTKTKFNIVSSKSNFSQTQVKEILVIHENTLMKFINTAIERLERKVDNLTTKNAVLQKEMPDFKSIMQFYSDIIDEKLVEVDANVSQVYNANDENIKTLIDDNKNLHVKVRDLKDRSRSNNLRLDGLHIASTRRRKAVRRSQN